MEQVRIGGEGSFVPKRIEKPSSFLRRKFEHNMAIEREFRAPFDDFGLELRSCRRFHIMTRIVGSAIRFSRIIWKRFHGWYRKKTRVTRISINFDHGGLPLVFPRFNTMAIPSVIPGYIFFLFSQLARAFSQAH